MTKIDWFRDREDIIERAFNYWTEDSINADEINGIQGTWEVCKLVRISLNDKGAEYKCRAEHEDTDITAYVEFFYTIEFNDEYDDIDDTEEEIQVVNCRVRGL